MVNILQALTEIQGSKWQLKLRPLAKGEGEKATAKHEFISLHGGVEPLRDWLGKHPCTKQRHGAKGVDHRNADADGRVRVSAVVCGYATSFRG